MMRAGTPIGAVLVAAALAMTACTGDDSTGTAGPSPSPATPQPTVTRPELTPRERAQQLAALAPESFNAKYRLKSKGPRPDASVRMRVLRERFRLDIKQRRRVAVLMYGPRGVISCQVVLGKKDEQNRRRRSCFLVSRRPIGLPELFDPELQWIFRNTQRALHLRGSDIRVHDAGMWRAPRGLGPTECFRVKGRDVENGTYCYLSRPGPTIGLLGRAVFPSGNLEIRDVKTIKRPEVFRPPVRPTPLPNP